MREHRAMSLSGLIALVALPLGACVVPPEGIVVSEAHNYPPEIFLEQVRPAAPVLLLGVDCTEFLVEVDKVTDTDHDQLLYRFITNNGIVSSRKLIFEKEINGTLRGVAIKDRIVRTDFIGGQDASPHVLSLFVTDAPAFAVPTDDTETGNLGTIVADPDGNKIRDFGVVEYRWVVVIDDKLGGGICSGV